MKYRFRSFLAPRIESYMAFIAKLGYRVSTQTTQSRSFDAYLKSRRITTLKQIDQQEIFRWVHLVSNHAAGTKNLKIRFARGFFRYLRRLGKVDHNPGKQIPYLARHQPTPHLYSLQEIHQILEQTQHVQRLHPNRLAGWTLETMIFLIYACGLRLSEALNLKIQDVDFREKTLSLWKTKFSKERLLPFSDVTAKKLKTFLALRIKRHPPSGKEAPFFGHSLGQYHRSTIEYHFRRLVVACGLAQPKGDGPCLHDLRHAFAVHRLYKWYQEGHRPLNKLPLLSTYMGHVCIKNTQVYLSITLALLREGDRRFQASFEKVTKHPIKRVLKFR